MVIGQRDAGGCGERDALVGRAEQYIESDIAVDDRLRVAAAQSCEVLAGVEQTGIEEIRADAAGFQGEIAEAQHPGVDGELDEIRLVVFHGNSGRYESHRPLSYTPGSAGGA